MTKVLAWHFVGDTLRDGREIPADGEVLVHDGPVEICATGLHASERLIDALNYAPGNTICRVECEDIVDREGDKFVCRKRTILWRLDGETVLREFSRMAALEVAHLWDMPDIVRQYLETGDESIRNAAMDAAVDAARNAAMDAAGNAAWGAAMDAAMDAARDAAWAAARNAAWGAAMDAAMDAARNAAMDAAWAAARDETIDKFNDALTRMVEEAHATENTGGQSHD